MTDVTTMPADSLQDRWDKAKICIRNGDRTGALFILKSLVKDGELAAYREVANAYELCGEYREAFHWYKQSVDIANDAWGAYRLGRLYCYGNGVDKDYEKALWYFDLAAENRISMAHLMLGRMYYLGWGVNKDLVKAEYHFECAADAGLVYAEKLLGETLMRKGNWLKGIGIYIRGIWHHYRLIMRDKHDPRLRSL